MELEQHRIVHESIVQGKDLVIQKLMLQLAVKDKLLRHQRQILQDHDLLGEVGSWQLNLINEHAAASGQGIYSTNDVTVALPNLSTLTSSSNIKIPIDMGVLVGGGGGSNGLGSVKENDDDDDDDDDSNSTSSNHRKNNLKINTNNNKSMHNTINTNNTNKTSVKSYYEMPITSAHDNENNLTNRTFTSTGGSTIDTMEYDDEEDDRNDTGRKNSGNNNVLLKKNISKIQRMKSNRNNSINDSNNDMLSTLSNDSNDDSLDGKYKTRSNNNNNQQQQQQQQTKVRGGTQGVARWGRSYRNMSNDEDEFDIETLNTTASNTNHNSSNNNVNNNAQRNNQQQQPPKFSVAGSSFSNDINTQNNKSLQNGLQQREHASVTNINSLMMKNTASSSLFPNSSTSYNNNSNSSISNKDKDYDNISLNSSEETYHRKQTNTSNINTNVNNPTMLNSKSPKSPLILPSTHNRLSSENHGDLASQLTLKGTKTGGPGGSSSSAASSSSTLASITGNGGGGNNQQQLGVGGAGSGASGANSIKKGTTNSNLLQANRLSMSKWDDSSSDDDNLTGLSGVGLGIKTTNSKSQTSSTNKQPQQQSSQSQSQQSSNSGNNGEMLSIAGVNNGFGLGGMSLSRVGNKIKQVLPSNGSKFGRVFQ